MRRNENDPGTPSDPPRRRRFDEYDDAWAAGDEDDVFDDPAGYILEDPAPDTSRADEVAPGVVPRRRHYRSRRMSSAYYDSPTYHRDRTHQGEYAEYVDKPKRDWSEPVRQPGPGLHVPYWQILILVILGLVAVLAVALACVSILTL